MSISRRSIMRSVGFVLPLLATAPSVMAMSVVDTVERDVRAIIAKIIGRSPASIRLNARVESYIEELDQVQLTLDIQQHFRIDVPDKEFERVNTAQDLINLVRRHLGRQRR